MISILKETFFLVAIIARTLKLHSGCEVIGRWLSFRSDQVISWAAKNIPQSLFVLYEQIGPCDPFGQIMQNHFHKINSSLHSLRQYPDAAAQRCRFLDQASMRTIYILQTTKARAIVYWGLFIMGSTSTSTVHMVPFRVGMIVCASIWMPSTLAWSLRRNDTEWSSWSRLMNTR